MNNKKKNILVWIFTWAALLLVVLYSPIGSPDLYSSSDYYAGVPNANLSGSNIGSSPNFDGSGSDYNELNVPDYSSAESSSKSSAGYSYTAPASGNTSSGAAASYSTSESQSYQNSKDGSSGSTGGGGSTFISNNGSSGGSDASSAVSMSSGGITTLSANLSMNSATKAPKSPGAQYNPNGVNDGGQHPGSNPDQGTRAPISDGWVFLLLLAAGYGIIKKRFFATE